MNEKLVFGEYRRVANANRTTFRLLGHELFTYAKMTKPMVWGSLVITAILGFFTGAALTSEFNFTRFFLVAIALAAGTAGCESITNRIDLPLDRLMDRTLMRPLPAGELDGRTAILAGSALLVIAVATSLVLGPLFLCLMVFGIVDNIAVYSFWLKRRTSQNILWGGFSGAIPVMFGFLASDPDSITLAILLFTLVFSWTPPHIWSLSVEFKEDYARAGIPMLPVVSGRRTWVTAISIFYILMLSTSLLLLITEGMDNIALSALVILDSISVALLIDFLKQPEEKAHRFFIFLNVYLVTVLIILFANAVI